MPFIHPLIFWTGLAAVSLPIIIHLLNRRRFKVKDWAAMKFLLESVRKNRRRLRIEELILLALRCLVIAVLAMAVARFTGCNNASARLGGDQGMRTNVYILDDSYSMGQRTGAASIFNAATSDLARELEKTKDTQQVAILPGSRTADRPAIARLNFLTDSKSLASRVRSMEPTDLRMQLADALAAAGETFKGVDGAKRLYVLSDFRKTDLAADDQVKAIRQQFSSLRKQGVEVVAMDYGRPAKNNLTIQGIRLLDRFAVAKTPLRVSVTVRNNGTATFGGGEMQLSAKMTTPDGLQDMTLPVQTLGIIEPGQTTTVEVQVTCQDPGPAVITATLPMDDLPADNVASLALDVRNHLRVLVVDGVTDLSDPTENESFYFQKALDPRRDGSHGFRIDAINEDAIGSVSFDDYDVVVLANVAKFPERQAISTPTSASAPADANARPPRPFLQLDNLERFVREGGGLVVFSGGHVDLGFYNDQLWAQGEGLIPLHIASPKGKPGPSDDYYRLNPKSIGGDWFLRTFQGDGGELTTLIRFFAFTPAQEAMAASSGDAGPPRVLARFTDPENSPAIAAHAFGKGSVVMVYSTVSSSWTNWPIPFGPDMDIYVPFMGDLMSYMAREQRPLSDVAGKAIEVPLSREWADSVVTLRTPRYPGEDEITLQAAPDDHSGVLKYEQPTGAGVYTIKMQKGGKGSQTILQARNPDPAEGDLTPGGQTALTAAFGGEDFVYVPMQSSASVGDVAAQARKEYWVYAALAALALLAAEVFLAQRFGHYTPTDSTKS